MNIKNSELVIKNISIDKKVNLYVFYLSKGYTKIVCLNNRYFDWKYRFYKGF